MPLNTTELSRVEEGTSLLRRPTLDGLLTVLERLDIRRERRPPMHATHRSHTVFEVFSGTECFAGCVEWETDKDIRVSVDSVPDQLLEFFRVACARAVAVKRGAESGTTSARP